MFLSGKKVLDYVAEPPKVGLNPNGIDIGVKEIVRIPSTSYAKIDGDKRIYVANGSIHHVTNDIIQDKPDISPDDGFYELDYGVYEIRLANKVHVPSGCVGIAFPRSTLNRFGVCMHQTAVWDSGYEGYGVLTIDVKIDLLRIAEDEHFIQFCLAEASTEGELYDGFYQGEE